VGKTKRSLGQVIEAIRGSGGIKKAIADRLGVSRNTVDNYLARWKSAREAYNEETEVFLDLAESILLMNLKLQHERQRKEREPVNSGDARWTLSARGGDRGYAPKQRQEITGKDGGPMVIKEVIVKIPEPDEEISGA